MFRPTIPRSLSIAICVPYRPANDRHRWLYDQIRPELEAFGWPIVEGTCEGRWSRAPAVNDAIRKAGKVDIIFLADCDTIPDHEGILRAVFWVAQTGGGARPHDQRYMLNQAGSLVAMQRGVRSLEPKHFERQQWQGGGLDVFTREAYEAVGGFDESYQGWGYEDSDFHVKLVVQRRWDRLPGEAWHLWHSTEANHPDIESRQRYRETMRKHKDALDRWAGNKGLRNAMSIF